MDISQAQLVATRGGLHRVAEHLLAGDLWRRTRKIGLRATGNGFGQPETLVDGVRRRVRIDGDALVVLDGDSERWTPLTSLAAAAAFAGCELGAPLGLYQAETSAEADDSLSVDPECAHLLGDCFHRAAAALESFRSANRAAHPSLAQVWPEHFDLAASFADINFGMSPGDAGHETPYLYVGPWVPPAMDEYWNRPFGALTAFDQSMDAADIVAFWNDGLRRLHP